MTSRWYEVLIKCRYEPKVIPILLAIIRIAVCFWPQTGYLHPDEFFQASDVIGGQFFGGKTNQVWEFKTDHPIRCMLIPSILIKLAFTLANLIQSKPSAYMLLVVPRIVYTLLSFSIDYCLYKLCQYYSTRGLWYLPVSVIFQTSFVCLGCLTRTLSNTCEVVIFALLLMVICQSMRPKFRIIFVAPNRPPTPVQEKVNVRQQILSSIFVGALLTMGVFNRPTFPCFALVPIIYWIIGNHKKNSYRFTSTIQQVVVPIGLSTVITAIFISAYDTFYYRGSQVVIEACQDLFFFRFNQLYQNLSSNWILTPYNFVAYNTNVDNLSKYGLHPPYTHMLLNVPLLFNVLGILFYEKIFKLLFSSGILRLLFSTHRIYALMLLSSIVSLILLSLVPHQEFRFLLPLIVPLVYAFGFGIYTSNKLLPMWLIANLVLVFFYTNVHQAGVTKAALDLDPILKSYIGSSDNDRPPVMVNVLAFKCYLVPSYQWNIPKGDNRFNLDLQDTFQDFNSSVKTKFDRVYKNHLDYPVYSHVTYILMPRIYEKELSNYLIDVYSINSADLKRISYYRLHFSGEEFLKSVNQVRENGLQDWNNAFGFSLLKLDSTSFRS